ncbi:MerR family transcriptional regulator [Mycolicibacterium komossense]|uniref:MerR family transcriptional regulator n=1 Tax=Mycolicibacterium komossense TaxID=1779 RepID=A0ABT3CEQ3_9MYCO|nr:MerR family transcriptional regulator [Mycolicibacterium komossense]MCV7227969.1 MerR family transcriptional regulator [Mycolicibacterium komossense]
MGWSTREIAALAGTSLRAVRHYHHVGLLAEPERRSNGYKQYGVAHLVRLVRIKRLTELGFSLPQIAAMGDGDDHPEQALRELDTELATTIDRLQRARDELALILEHSAPTDLPTAFVPQAVVSKLSEADRSLVVVLTRVLGPRGKQVYADLLENSPDDPVAAAFDALAPDADESTRQDIAEHLVPYIHALRAANPGLTDAETDAPNGALFVQKTVGVAVAELYNEAQLDVLRRAGRMLSESG